MPSAMFSYVWRRTSHASFGIFTTQTTRLGAFDDPDFSRTSRLAEVLQELRSYVRYLRASSPVQTPPGIQVALSELTKLHFPSENGSPICLVRPQWKYNLACVYLALARSGGA